MAAFIMETVDIGAGYNESLAERLASGVLPVPYALICATDVASTLRDLHQKGLAHGEVNLGSIRLSESGARLQPRGSRTRLADTRSDVAAFGAVLYEMMTGLKPPSDVKSAVFTPVTTAMDMGDVRTDAIRLAEKCLDGSPDMKQVLIELRILGILTRRLAVLPYRLQAVETPVMVAPEPHRLRVVERPVPVEPEPPFPEFDDLATEPERPKVAVMPARVAPEPQRPQVAVMPAKVASEPLFPQVAELPSKVASEPQCPQVAVMPATLSPEPQQSQVAELPATVESEVLPDAAPDQPVAGMVICPRCSGDAPFTSPTSIFDKLLNRISHIRQCDLCGYRFIILRFVWHKS
jgi:hypothetical protein